MKVSVEDAGMEEITVDGSTSTASHYVVTGDLQRELWYDAQDRLVNTKER